MALSGSFNFTVTRDDIIESALKITGTYDAGEAVPAAELTDAAQRLNLILKEWHVEGMQMPIRRKNVLILNRNRQRYRLGNVGTTNTNDDFHFFDMTALFENAIVTTAQVATDTVINIDEETWIDYQGITKTANTSTNDTLSVGIRLDSDAIHWSTQSGYDAGANTITITHAIPTGEAAAVGNKVYAYVSTNRATRPAKILYAYRSDTSGNDAQVDIVGRKEYERLSAKDSEGPPTKIHYAPAVRAFGDVADGDSAGELFVWPAKNPSNVDKLYLVTEQYIDDFDGATEHIPLPIEWGNALIWNLAAELAFEYGIDRPQRNDIFAVAEQKKRTILDAYDNEGASFQMAREMSGR